MMPPYDLSLNKRGLFPIPGENEIEFVKRSVRVKSSLDTIQRHLSNRAEIAASGLDISPDYLLAFYSNCSMLFLHGAITLIAEEKEIVQHLQQCAVLPDHFSRDANNPPLACIQLRSGFQKKRFFRIYSSDVVLSHEMIHAARYLFDSPRFEEILAFQTSKNRFRRFLGPLFQKPFESYLFMLCLFLFGFTLGTNLYINSGLTLLFFFLMLRLSWNQFLFHRCKEKTSSLLKDPRSLLAFLIRLTDEEIVQFSHWPQEKIASFIKEKKNYDFRWGILYQCYFEGSE